MEILVPISIGELYDKISILEIKKERITDPNKLKNIKHEFEELSILNKIWQNGFRRKKHELDVVLYTHVKDINEKIWDLEDKIRRKEEIKVYDDEFIQLARSIYFWNDKRAQVKREINLKYSSDIIEEKSYKKYSNEV